MSFISLLSVSAPLHLCRTHQQLERRGEFAATLHVAALRCGVCLLTRQAGGNTSPRLRTHDPLPCCHLVIARTARLIAATLPGVLLCFLQLRFLLRRGWRGAGGGRAWRGARGRPRRALPRPSQRLALVASLSVPALVLWHLADGFLVCVGSRVHDTAPAGPEGDARERRASGRDRHHRAAGAPLAC